MGNQPSDEKRRQASEDRDTGVVAERDPGAAAADRKQLGQRRSPSSVTARGGIVVREMLVDKVDAFKDKHVGLVLIASPSLGSPIASGLSWVIDIYKSLWSLRR